MYYSREKDRKLVFVRRRDIGFDKRKKKKRGKINQKKPKKGKKSEVKGRNRGGYVKGVLDIILEEMGLGSVPKKNSKQRKKKTQRGGRSFKSSRREER